MSKYNHFGVMLDCSRDGVLKVDAVKKFASIINKLGYNTIMLYTEDTYEVLNEPYFGYMRGAYTKDEIKEMDDYLKSLNMELIPCIQTLAHFTNLCKLPQYFGHIDVNDILLIDDEKTYTLLENIFETLEQNFTSRYVNIGMDEAHMVGLGRYLDEHGFQNRTELLLKHLNKVCDMAKKHGFKPIMWSDMFFRLASKGDYYQKGVHIGEDVKKLMPDNIELAYWDYYHKNKEDYDGMIESHLEFDRNVWFAGGAWSWNGFAPCNNYSLLTMEPAMMSVKEHNIENVILTMWGDNGNECSFFSLLPSLYKIRMISEGITDIEVIKKGFFDAVGVSYDDFMLLDIPNNRTINQECKRNENLSKCLFYQDPFMGYFDKSLENLTVNFKEYKEVLESKEVNEDYKYIFNYLSDLCNVLELKYNLGVKTRKAYKENDIKELKNLIKKVYPQLIKRVEKFYNSFKIRWDKENKSFGFEIHDARIGGLIQRLKSCRNTLNDYVNHKIERIDVLEKDLLLMTNDDFIYSNVYQLMMSFSKL